MWYLWSYESWGDGEPPENWESICEAVNGYLKTYAETHGAELAGEKSGELWERYSEAGSLEGVEAWFTV